MKRFVTRATRLALAAVALVLTLAVYITMWQVCAEREVLAAPKDLATKFWSRGYAATTTPVVVPVPDGRSAALLFINMTTSADSVVVNVVNPSAITATGTIADWNDQFVIAPGETFRIDAYTLQTGSFSYRTISSTASLAVVSTR